MVFIPWWYVNNNSNNNNNNNNNDNNNNNNNDNNSNVLCLSLAVFCSIDASGAEQISETNNSNQT